jgi:6-phosphogluconolactonase
MWLFSLILAFGSVATAQAPDSPAPAKLRVYVGTYTSPGTSQGIYMLELDPASGTLTDRGLAGEMVNPSYLAIHPSRRFLCAVGEVADYQGSHGGAVVSFAIDEKTGALTSVNHQSSKGPGPCYIAIDRAGKNALVANYGGGSVAVLPIGEDGSLDEASAFVQHAGTVADPKRQGGPHAHSINLDAANRFAVVADLGLDKLLIYRFDSATGTLTPNDPPFARLPPRSGPRHFAFHPDGRHAYAINEINCTVTAFDYDPETGTLKALQTVSTLPAGMPVKPSDSTAHVEVHPSGKFLYGSNRGHDSLAIFAIDAETGKLSPVGRQPTGGKTPRNFGIDPTGSILLAANQGSGTVVAFRVDRATGKLTPTGQVVKVPAPVCVKFMRAE